MTFSHSDLDHIIRLAHLEVDSDLKEKFLPQIQSILGHMDSINKFDLTDVPAAATAFSVEMTLRDDVVVIQPDLRLATNAPSWNDHAFVVPRIN